MELRTKRPAARPGASAFGHPCAPPARAVRAAARPLPRPGPAGRLSCLAATRRAASGPGGPGRELGLIATRIRYRGDSGGRGGGGGATREAPVYLPGAPRQPSHHRLRGSSCSDLIISLCRGMGNRKPPQFQISCRAPCCPGRTQTRRLGGVRDLGQQVPALHTYSLISLERLVNVLRRTRSRVLKEKLVPSGPLQPLHIAPRAGQSCGYLGILRDPHALGRSATAPSAGVGSPGRSQPPAKAQLALWQAPVHLVQRSPTWSQPELVNRARRW